MKIYYLVNKKTLSYDKDIKDRVNVFCITENDLFLAIKKINQYIIDNIYYLNYDSSEYSFKLKTKYNYEDNLVYSFIINYRLRIDSAIEFEIIKHIET